jgi:hypothetical protein
MIKSQILLALALFLFGIQNVYADSPTISIFKPNKTTLLKKYKSPNLSAYEINNHELIGLGSFQVKLSIKKHSMKTQQVIALR